MIVADAVAKENAMIYKIECTKKITIEVEANSEIEAQKKAYTNRHVDDKKHKDEAVYWYSWPRLKE